MSFRLSEDEYESLRRTCVSQGVRSISDFARFATQQWIASEGEPVQETITELRGKIRALDLELKELARRTFPAGGAR